jgi:hypothetical protein
VGGNNDIGDVCSYINGTEGVERERGAGIDCVEPIKSGS